MISWNRINELKEDIGEEDFAEIAAIFLEEVTEVIDRLKVNPVPEKLEEDLHFLKGSALNLGFEALSKLCHDGEQYAANKEYSSIALAPVFETYEKSCIEFNAK